MSQRSKIAREVGFGRLPPEVLNQNAMTLDQARAFNPGVIEKPKKVKAEKVVEPVVEPVVEVVKEPAPAPVSKKKKKRKA